LPVRRPPLDLREAAEAFDLQELCRTLQLGEVLLDASIWQFRQYIGSQLLDR